MLVLTRKMDEQILIGEDIKITLVRVRGNSVRIGIEAPKHVRVVRGELTQDNERVEDHAALNQSQTTIRAATTTESEGNHASMPSATAVKTPVSIHGPASASQVENVSASRASKPRIASQVFVGNVRRDGQKAFLSAAPLARFMPIQ